WGAQGNAKPMSRATLLRRPLDSELFQAVLERAVREAEEASGLRDHPAGALHSLHDELALELLDVDPVSRDLEAVGTRGRRGLEPDLDRQVLGADDAALREEDRALHDALELPHVAGPRMAAEEVHRGGLDRPHRRA